MNIVCLEILGHGIHVDVALKYTTHLNTDEDQSHPRAATALPDSWIMCMPHCKICSGRGKHEEDPKATSHTSCTH